MSKIHEVHLRGVQGVLLCGGSSSRMGFPKGLLPIHGTTLGLYLGGLLETVCGKAPLLVGAGDLGEAPAHWRQVADLPGASGPLAGLLALANSQHPLLVLAVDMAGMHDQALRWLLECADERPAESKAVWPRLQGRPFGEPLAAIYRPEALAAMRKRFDQGTRAVYRALSPDERWEPVIPNHLQSAFSGVNTPDEWFALTGSLPPGSDTSC